MALLVLRLLGTLVITGRQGTFVFRRLLLATSETILRLPGASTTTIAGPMPGEVLLCRLLPLATEAIILSLLPMARPPLDTLLVLTIRLRHPLLVMHTEGHMNAATLGLSLLCRLLGTSMPMLDLLLLVALALPERQGGLAEMNMIGLLRGRSCIALSNIRVSRTLGITRALPTIAHALRLLLLTVADMLSMRLEIQLTG